MAANGYSLVKRTETYDGLCKRLDVLFLVTHSQVRTDFVYADNGSLHLLRHFRGFDFLSFRDSVLLGG